MNRIQVLRPRQCSSKPDRRARGGRLATFALLLSSMTGACAMPSQVRAPRTLEKGRFEHAIGLQRAASGVILAAADADNIGNKFGRPSRSDPKPLTPTYSLRVGLLDDLEFGVKASMLSLGLEGTYQLVESRLFDLAVGLDLGWVPMPVHPDRELQDTRDSSRASVAAPLLLGLNVLEELTIIALAAPVYAADSIHLQVGGGMDLRLSRAIRLRPHVSFLAPAVFDPARRRAIQQSDSIFSMSSPYIIYGLELSFAGSRGYEGVGF